MSLEVLSKSAAVVAEAPHWDERTGEVCWVDIPRGEFFRHNLSTGTQVKTSVFQPLGAAVPRSRGGFVGAVRDGIATFTDSYDFEVVTPLQLDRPDIRMNDAKCDTRGRLWAGTMEDHNTAPGRGLGTLYRINTDFSAVVAVAKITQGNGLGWSPDDLLMYFIDTRELRIDVFDYDADSGGILNRRVFRETPEGVFPDGLTVDAEGGIWVALFGAGRVQRFKPDGSEDISVELPVSEVTSCTFGGPRLDTMFITTASVPIDGWGREALAGYVFAAHPGQTGLPSNNFAG